MLDSGFSPSAIDPRHIGSPGDTGPAVWAFVPLFRRGPLDFTKGALASFCSLTGLFSPKLCTTAIWYKAPRPRIYGPPLEAEFESHSRTGFHDQSGTPFRAHLRKREQGFPKSKVGGSSPLGTSTSGATPGSSADVMLPPERGSQNRASNVRSLRWSCGRVRRTVFIERLRRSLRFYFRKLDHFAHFGRSFAFQVCNTRLEHTSNTGGEHAQSTHRYCWRCE